jgi:hypothetical protein
MASRKQQTEFARLIAQWDKELAALNKPLARWGKRQVDFDDEAALEELGASHPFQRDQELRKRFYAVVHAMVLVYLEGEPDQCRRIRMLLTKHPAVRRDLCLPGGKPLRSARDGKRFREYLAIMSMRDQGDDMRDELLTLADVVHDALQAKIKVAPYLEEIAALSSRADKYGMGSMQGALRSMTKKRVKELRDYE